MRRARASSPPRGRPRRRRRGAATAGRPVISRAPASRWACARAAAEARRRTTSYGAVYSVVPTPSWSATNAGRPSAPRRAARRRGPPGSRAGRSAHTATGCAVRPAPAASAAARRSDSLRSPATPSGIVSQPAARSSSANRASSVTASTAGTEPAARQARAVSRANAAASARRRAGSTSSRDLPRAGGFTGSRTTYEVGSSRRSCQAAGDGCVDRVA